MPDSKFLLLLGVSGVGKSTIMRILRQWDAKFVYISPYITRPLREGEQDKVSISNDVMDTMAKQGEFLTINTLFGIRYATPKKPIVEALQKGNYPLLDWPIDKLEVMRQSFPQQLYVVYLEPPTIKDLQTRLAKDSRDSDGSRLESAVEELAQLRAGRYNGLYDLHIVVTNDKEEEVAQTIYDSYILSTKGGL